MKKIISLILALMMLVSACAMAAGKEITISNVIMGDNADSVIDFSGIELKFAAAEKEGMAGVSVAAVAAGEDAARVVLSADEAGLYLSANGISDVYSVSMETIEMLISGFVAEDEVGLEAVFAQISEIVVASGEKLIGIFEGSVTEAGTQEVSGEEYMVYNVNITAENMMEIYGIMDQFIALYPAAMEGTGYSSITEMIEGEDVEITIDGQILINEECMMYDLYGYVDGEAVNNIFCSAEEVYYEELDLNGFDVYVAFYDPAIEDVDAGEMGYAFLTIYTDPESGEFVMVDLSIGDGQNEDDGIYAALNLGGEGSDEAFDYFAISTLDDVAEIFVAWGEDEEGYNVVVEMTDTEEDFELQAAYLMPEDGKGNIGIVANTGADEVVLSADITVAETDGAWLPEIGETVDILSVDEAQIEKLTMEAMGVLGQLMSACSAACEDFSEIMAQMM